MKKTIVTSCIIVIMLITGCSPQSKQNYIERYAEFISEVKMESDNYTEVDWLEQDKVFNRFSIEWFNEFENELTWKEQLLITKNEFIYNTLRVKSEINSISDIFLTEDYNDLKQQIKEYAEKDMDEDISFIINQAKEAGEETTKLIESILDELDLKLEEFE